MRRCALVLSFVFVFGCSSKATPTLVPLLPPLDQKSSIELTNEAVLATNMAISTAIVATETAKAIHAPPTWTPKPSRTPRPTNTPVVRGQTSTPRTVVEPATLVVPTLTPIPQLSITEAEFRSYVRDKYSSIAGHRLDIEDVTIFDEGDLLRSVSIELSRDSALYVFAEQTRADALDYAKRLLNDTVAYFAGQDCLAVVSDNFYSSRLLDIYFDDEWYYIGDWSIYEEGWYISRDYVQAHFRDGQEHIEVWNYK